MGDQERKNKPAQLQRLRRRLDAPLSLPELQAVLKALLELLENEL